MATTAQGRSTSLEGQRNSLFSIPPPTSSEYISELTHPGMLRGNAGTLNRNDPVGFDYLSTATTATFPPVTEASSVTPQSPMSMDSWNMRPSVYDYTAAAPNPTIPHPAMSYPMSVPGSVQPGPQLPRGNCQLVPPLPRNSSMRAESTTLPSMQQRPINN